MANGLKNLLGGAGLSNSDLILDSMISPKNAKIF